MQDEITIRAAQAWLEIRRLALFPDLTAEQNRTCRELIARHMAAVVKAERAR